MIDEFAGLDDGLPGLPTMPLDLSSRMREIRARQNLKQSEVARRMKLDPSIPSLWEQGKRPVPANRIVALAEALGVSVSELLAGVNGAPEPAEKPVVEAPVRQAVVDFPAREAVQRSMRADRAPLMTLVSQMTVEPPSAPDDLLGGATETSAPSPAEFVPAPRPELLGWIPDGWEPDDRVQDVSPALLDGYWLDPVRMEKPNARRLLRSRLCAADQALIEDKEVPGAAIAHRIYRHCSRQSEYFANERVPLIEAIFRAVLAADYGGLTVDGLVEALRGRTGSMPVNQALLRRLRDSVRPYPIVWVDRELFR